MTPALPLLLGPDAPALGAAVLVGDVDGEEVRVGLWRWPHDPALPALAAVADVRIRAYRPGRRAVLEVTGGGPPLYCKIVRPSRVVHGPGADEREPADVLRARHDLLADALPVPPVLAATPDGLLVLPALPGTPLRTLIDDGGPLPDGPALDALLDRLPPAVAALPRTAGHLARVRHFADVLALTAVTDPDARARLERLVVRLEATDPGRHTDVPVHGDFYEGQLLADGAVVTGLLDVDTAGPGHRIDEWATMLAHLSVLDRAPAQRYGAALLAHAESRFPRRQLRSRIAAAIIGLASGPYRVQQPGRAAYTARRLTLAEQWAGMRAPSSRSPGPFTPRRQPSGGGPCGERPPEPTPRSARVPKVRTVPGRGTARARRRSRPRRWPRPPPSRRPSARLHAAHPVRCADERG